MNLKSPREDPYSVENSIRKDLEKKGYASVFRVIDTEKLGDSNGNHYLKGEVSVDLIYRHKPDNKGFNFSNSNKEEVEFFAISTEGGSKGYLERHARDPEVDVVDQFLAEVAVDDSLSTHYY